MKQFLLSLPLVLAIGASCPSAQTPDVMPGPWTLNVAKSTYSPGPAPKSQHAVLTAIPNGIRTVSDRVAADGTMVHFEWNGTFDGRDRPVIGDPARDAVSVKKIDAYTLEVTNKKGGQVTTVLHSEYAKDGKTRVETITGTDARGRAVKNVTYWTRP